MFFVADFETNKDATIWAASLLSNKGEYYLYYTLDDFMDRLLRIKKGKVYFHNLKFDGEFIVSWLLRNGYEWSENLTDKTFNTLISGLGQWFSITIFNNGERIQIKDSLKVIPLKVEDIPKAFGLKVTKGEIDYSIYRQPGNEIKEEEKDYIRRDCEVVLEALRILKSEGNIKDTTASNALYHYKESIGGENIFKKWFPIGNDGDIRKSYRGGYTRYNNNHPEVYYNDLVLDNNSLYPFVMNSKLLPFGDGIEFIGEYKYDKNYPLYIQRIYCEFKLKEEKWNFPIIQIKGLSLYNETEYLKESKGIEELWVTGDELKLIKEFYDLSNLTYAGGLKYKGRFGMFSKFLEKFRNMKEEATKSGNKGLRYIAKLNMNSLYGKFGTNPKSTIKIPYIDENEIVKYKVEESERDGIYLPMGIFITAYAREITIRASREISKYGWIKYNKECYIYSDTDSIHTLLQAWEVRDILEIDNVIMGKWKIENWFRKSKYIRSKSYIGINNKKHQVTIAGVPKNCRGQVTMLNFEPGLVIRGKLVPKRIKNGVYLSETEFSIKG